MSTLRVTRIALLGLVCFASLFIVGFSASSESKPTVLYMPLVSHAEGDNSAIPGAYTACCVMCIPHGWYILQIAG